MNYENINPYNISEERISVTWVTPVYNRKKQDVDYLNASFKKGYDKLTASEQLAWLNGLTGAVNESDLERIQNNIKFISESIELNLTVSDVPSMPQVAFYNEMLTNISTIRKNTAVHATTPSVPSIPLNTISKWNNIEKILNDVYLIIQNNFYHYTGESFMCGDEIGLIL